MRDGDVAVVVAGDAFDVLLRQQFGQSLGQHDHAELLSFGLFADAHRGHDPLDDLVQVHHAADFLAPVLALTVSSLVSNLPVMSSTLITRLASPAMAAP